MLSLLALREWGNFDRRDRAAASASTAHALNSSGAISCCPTACATTHEGALLVFP